jgi:hypothetical protein
VLQRPLEQFFGAVCGAKKKKKQGEVKKMSFGNDSIPKRRMSSRSDGSHVGSDDDRTQFVVCIAALINQLESG